MTSLRRVSFRSLFGPIVVSTPEADFTLPNIYFLQGTADTFDLSTYATGFPATGQSITVTSGSLPTGVTLNETTGVLSYNGTSPDSTVTGVVFTIDVDEEADWIARSTAAGVTFATDFRDAADFAPMVAAGNGGHVYAAGLGAEMANVVQDTTDGITGGACLRIDSPAAGGPNSAAWVAPLNDAWTVKTQGFGTTPFWIQYRFKIPASRLTLSNCSGQKGWKFTNVAHYSQINTASESASNRLDEHVLQDSDQYGLPQAYHRNTAGGYPAFTESFGAYDYKLQNAVDNGSGLSNADRYCLWTNGGATITPGCWYWPANEWITIKMRIEVATYGGTTGNKFDLYVARRNATSWTQVITSTGHDVGGPSEFTGGLNGIWLLNYETNRIDSTVSTHQKWDQLIVSTNDIALPAAGA